MENSCRGGHWPAMEEPELWTNEIRSFFKDYRQLERNNNNYLLYYRIKINKIKNK